MSDVAILVPVLRRPHRIRPLLESIESATPEPHRVLFIASPDDGPTHDTLRGVGAEWFCLDASYEGQGDYARKINAGYRHTTEPLIFCGADDLHFHPAWFERARARLRSRVGVVGTNDLGNPRVRSGRHATHSLVTRAYADRYGTIDEPGKILHEGYQHEYVDDELVATAKHRRAWAFAEDSIVEHLHVMWGKAPMDDLYAAHPARMTASRPLYRERQRLWR